MITSTINNKLAIKTNLSYCAVLLVAMMGSAVTLLLPLMVGTFTDSQGYSTQQVGFLAVSDIAGILLSSASAYFWVRRCHWKKLVSFSLLLFIGANFATSWVSDFSTLMMIRFIAGLACGVSYSITLAALGDRINPDKAFGDMVTIQVIYGTLGFALLPNVIAQWGYAGIFQFFNFTLILAFLMTLLAFPSNNKQQQSFDIDLRLVWQPTALVFAGVVCYYFAQGTIWAYLERMGGTAGLSAGQIGTILSVGLGVSAVGSWLSGWAVKRIGRHGVIWLTVVIQLPCLLALFYMQPNNAWLIYAVATITYQIFWSFIVPVMMAIFNDVDKSGRLIVFCVSAFKVGLVLGAPVAALVITMYSLKHVIALGATAIVLSAIFLVLANKKVAP